MPQDLPPFANAEDVMQQLLVQQLPTVSTRPVPVPVVKATSDTLTPPTIEVTLLGGTSDYVTYFPEIQVVAYDTTRSGAMQLAFEVQAVVENSFNSIVFLPSTSTRVLIDGTATLTSGHPEVYENNDIRYVPAVYHLSMRRPRTYV